MRTHTSSRRGFTLIELLIVVAIIAILAAIAVPNFLEAQTRAKVSRVRADLRTLATALEAYRLDSNKYPPNSGIFTVVPIELSTPVSYLTSARLVDPFTDKERDPVYGDLVRHYTYNHILTIEEAPIHFAAGNIAPAEALDLPGQNPGALSHYGPWLLLSHGPDRIYSEAGTPAGPWNINASILRGRDIPYDPTNGTVSFGNITRTQRHAEVLPPR